jgi:hypothetical protein
LLASLFSESYQVLSPQPLPFSLTTPEEQT